MARSSRGHIQRLPSGSFRVKVYAGTDPVTGKQRLLRQTCPDEASAHAALGRLLAEADGGRFPDRHATIGQALDKYLEVADLEVSTREAHQGYVRRTIGPVLGEVKIRQLGADSLDALYTALKKCSRLCGRLPRTEHHTDGEHACDQRCGPLRDHRTTRPHICDARCRPHACKPMKPATILRIHSIISSALDLAVRYDWADRNVAKNASPPHPRKREPDPPSPDQAARLLNLVWTEDEEFGLYLWTAFTTGARRGEVSALRENRFDFTRQQVRLARNYLVKQGQHIEKAPKDGEGRVLSLDLLTCELFQERFQRRRVEARVLGVQVPEDAFAFSPDPAGREPWNPDTMTHRYRRYARRVGITSSLKELRHYSATQLLAAGTDLNTVAGRLGHAEGSTTLKFYASSPGPPTSALPRSSPSSSTDSARRNAFASCTVSRSRLPGATALLPSPLSSVRRLGLKKMLPSHGSPSSQQPTTAGGRSTGTPQTFGARSLLACATASSTWTSRTACRSKRCGRPCHQERRRVTHSGTHT